MLSNFINKLAFTKIFWLWNHHILNYITFKNLNYNYAFGSTLSFLMIIQILTGFIMTLYYIPSDLLAFNSVEIITNELSYGFFIRYLHMNIASFLFIFIYLHIGRNIYYGLYSRKNTSTWFIGYVIFILLIVISFLGYVLPWGQMSFRRSTVITNLLAILPYGDRIVEFIWGGVNVSGITLQKFFTLHYILPFIMLAAIVIHFAYLHKKNSTDPKNVWNIITNEVNLYPYYIIKNSFIFFIVSIILIFTACYYPYIFANPVNEIGANPLVTPEHILPKWYSLPFYWILKFTPSKNLGILLMALFILSPLLMPIFLGLEFKLGNIYLNYFEKGRFYIISFIYISLAFIACDTIFSNHLCAILLFLYFWWVLFPFKYLIYIYNNNNPFTSINNKYNEFLSAFDIYGD